MLCSSVHNCYPPFKTTLDWLNSSESLLFPKWKSLKNDASRRLQSPLTCCPWCIPVCVDHSELIVKLKFTYRTIKTYSYHFSINSFIFSYVYNHYKMKPMLFSDLFWPYSPVRKKHYFIFCDLLSPGFLLIPLFCSSQFLLWAYFSYPFLKHLHALCWPHHLSITFSLKLKFQWHSWFQYPFMCLLFNQKLCPKHKSHSLATS